MRSLAQVGLGMGALVVLSAPALSWACPYCATRDEAGGAGVMLLGAMIVVPFLIVASVVPALRRAAAADLPFIPTDTE